MKIQRWDPFQEVRQLMNTPGLLLRGLGAEPFDQPSSGWTVPLDVVGNSDSLVVSASIPGVAPEDVKVTVEDGVLTIAGSLNEEQKSGKVNYLLRERRAGSFYRSLRLPDGIESEGAESDYRNGVLRITFPIQDSKKPTVIDVKVHN